MWVPHDVRDHVVDFVRRWSEKPRSAPDDSSTGWECGPVSSTTGESAMDASMNTTVGFPVISGYSRGRSGPSSAFHLEHPLEGYRRLTFMMLDADVVAVSPSSVWRVLQQAGLLSRWKGRPSRKGSGFEQPRSRTSIGISMFPTST
jgi:hypothetical protein